VTLLGVLLAGVLAVAGCGGGSDDDSSTGSPGGGSTSPAAASPSTPLFPDDFRGVCSGATQSRATPYDTSAPSHKALWFATYQDDLLDQSTHLPPDWTVAFSSAGDALKAIDLVGCAVRTADKVVKNCSGYQDNGKDTGNKVRWHTATYELTVHEAVTGKVLAQETVEATDASCPSFETFDGENETIDDYASVPDAKVTALLKKYVQP
jgi:hypothetical protein